MRRAARDDRTRHSVGRGRGASRGLPLVGGVVHADAPRDLLALRGQRPGVGLALRVPRRRCSRAARGAPGAPGASRPGPGRGSPRGRRPRGCSPAGAPRSLREPSRCDTSGASRHHPAGRSPRARTSPAAAGSRPAIASGRGPGLLAARRRRALVGQHDHAHQLPQQTGKRPALTPYAAAHRRS